MRILYVASDQQMETEHGGTIHVSAVCSELLRSGHEIHLIIQGGARHAVLPGGITVHRISQTHRFLLWTKGTEIQRKIDEIQPAIVMERYYNFAGEAIIRASRSKIPTVLEVNSPMIEYPGSLKSRVDTLLFGFMRKRRERIAEHSTAIISPIKEIVPSDYRAKTTEIEWGADTDLFDPSVLPDQHLLRIERNFGEQEVLLIHFGSLRKWHGVEKLLTAYRSALDRLPQNTRLIIVGPASDALRSRWKDVHFAGEVPHRDLPSWLKAADAAILPFAPEEHRYLALGFYWSPLKLFEAMSMELPVLTLDHPRLKQLLGSENSAFYYNGSKAHLADQIVNIAVNLNRLKREAQQFRDRVLKNYSWQAHGEKLDALLRKVALTS